MKKNVLLIAVVILAALLFMFRLKGFPAHIGVSVIGLVVLIAYTVATKKSWKLPALEILYRICYAVALISGIVLMNVHGIIGVMVLKPIGRCIISADDFLTIANIFDKKRKVW